MVTQLIYGIEFLKWIPSMDLRWSSNNVHESFFGIMMYLLHHVNDVPFASCLYCSNLTIDAMTGSGRLPLRAGGAT